MKKSSSTHILVISKDEIYYDTLVKKLESFGYTGIEVIQNIENSGFRLNEKVMTILIFDTDSLRNGNDGKLQTLLKNPSPKWAFLNLAVSSDGWAFPPNVIGGKVDKIDTKKIELARKKHDEKEALILEHLSKVSQVVTMVDGKLHDANPSAIPLIVLLLGASIVFGGIQFSALWLAILGILTMLVSMVIYLMGVGEKTHEN